MFKLSNDIYKNTKSYYAINKRKKKENKEVKHKEEK